MADIATQAGHWYAPDGLPFYTIIGKNGKERATTIRDARERDLRPSVTTITRDTLPSYGLVEWKINQAIDSALTLPKLESESLDDYKKRVKQDAEEQSKKAMEFGTSVHTAIEVFMAGKHVDPQYSQFCISALAELERFIPDFDLSKCESERSFVHKDLRYGGKVDLHSRELNFVLDFKTKAFSPEQKIQVWDEQKLQLAAYKEGLGMPKARALNVFISTTHPGLVRIVEHDITEHERYWKIFQSLLNTWELLKW
jgi:hypothetical protein